MTDAPNWKSRLQSQTVRAVILAAVVSVANAAVAVSGVQLDVQAIEFWSDIGLRVLGEGITLGLLWKAYQGRLKADTPIRPLPWKEEVKTVIRKGDKA